MSVRRRGPRRASPRRSPRAVAGVLAAGILAAASGCAERTGGKQSAAAGGVASSDATASSLPLASFDQAWSRIAATYPHADMRGIDWKAVRDELRPRAAQAATADAVRPVIQEMLERLGESHFEVIPGASYARVQEALGPPSSPQPARASRQPTSAAVAASAEPVRGGRGDVGLDVRLVDGQALVVQVDEGGPADRAGVKPGWVLLRAGGLDVAQVEKRVRAAVKDPAQARLEVYRAIALALRGAPGTPLTAELLHGGGRPAKLDIVRRVEPGELTQLGNLPALLARFDSRTLPGTRTGYIRFNMFLAPVSAPFSQAVRGFVADHADGIVVDLRGNPGGIGAMVMGMAGHFVDKPGLSLGRMTMRDATLDFVANPRGPGSTFDGPLAILVDELTMSTSELLAAGLQGLGRARVFGQRSPGMALPSIVESLPDGDRLQFAVADLVGPKGERIEGHGVQPDEVIPLTRERLLSGGDPVLAAATAWIAASGR